MNYEFLNFDLEKPVIVYTFAPDYEYKLLQICPDRCSVDDFY